MFLPGHSGRFGYTAVTEWESFNPTVVPRLLIPGVILGCQHLKLCPKMLASHLRRQEQHRTRPTDSQTALGAEKHR